MILTKSLAIVLIVRSRMMKFSKTTTKMRFRSSKTYTIPFATATSMVIARTVSNILLLRFIGMKPTIFSEMTWSIAYLGNPVFHSTIFLILAPLEFKFPSAVFAFGILTADFSFSFFFIRQRRIFNSAAVVTNSACFIQLVTISRGNKCLCKVRTSFENFFIFD